ncbi:PP2C family protein-serine/threonine phosphatase [Alkalihalobacterium elongatum]|uniref:PP2C family protein-serine/threonine phosphatase n=1 Tax=Alkalihalobacterium elongatum TaxID=2675466 RepID=UPI001C1F25F5|nr:PP2C family protein-serine/threonine phosphatase [Alkalihalobacterium elongatum]
MIEAESQDLTLQSEYKDLLRAFLENKSEQDLYDAQQYSKRLLENQISPEEMVSLHCAVLEEIFEGLPIEITESFSFLLEVMIGYGLAYREHQSLRDKQLELEMQIDVAANMQQTLLPKKIPQIPGVDIGVISVPAGKMSGDYYYCVKNESGHFGVAIADIIGKGIPAAMCMSMIKYAIDSMPSYSLEPGVLLKNLNRVVEQNIDPSMFITMMYGSYDAVNHTFVYSGAGHEPGFYFNASEGKFRDLYAKGLVLGVSNKTNFREQKIKVSVGDAIVLLSDGVTECRIGDRFIEREEINDLLINYIDLPAQEMVERVYDELAQLQDFKLNDDFTLMVLRRQV